MQRVILIVGWILVISLGAFLRFDDLASRPFHFDEATGAKIAAARMESNGGKFNPKHHHGPLLGDLAIAVCRLRGEEGWREMSKLTLRLVPAVAGLLLVLAPLCWRRRFGDVAVLLAAACFATSPLMVYYSRMFIHEILLALFGVLALAALTCGPRPLAAGFLIGLMYATKESFAISMIAWTGAAGLTALGTRGWRDREVITDMVRTWWKPALGCALAAGVTAGLLYTDFLRYPRGAIDAVQTYFVYETVDGHDKPFAWYLEFLAWPKKAAGVWWFETPLLLLALLAFAATFFRNTGAEKHKHLIRFLAFAAAGHFMIYGLIAYKTPWLACLPWAHVCLLAGFAVACLPAGSPRWRAGVVALTTVCLLMQARLAWTASGRLASDERNPYAYVPTRRDVEKLEEWLQRIREKAPAGTADAAGVVGSEYWPLPWYLRSFGSVGYWKTPPDDLAELPFVFAMPESAEAVGMALAGSHVSLPRGLRADVPLILFVKNDVWKLWMEDGK